MKILIATILLLSIASLTGAVDYVAITPDNTVSDRNAIEVRVTTQVETSQVRTLHFLLAQVKLEEAKRDEAIEQIRKLVAEIALVEVEVNKVVLQK